MESLIIKCITVSCPERATVDTFVKSQYKERMNVSPSLPEIVFAAFRGVLVVGAVGLEFPEHTDNVLPCEKIFSFDWSALELHAQRHNSVQFSRWAVAEHEEDKSLSKRIVFKASLYAIEQGKRYGWCELKPKVATHLKRLRVSLYKVSHVRINVESIGESVREYYLTPPYPGLYQLDLFQMAQALQ